MLLICLLALAVLWVCVLAVVAGVCASAARGDRVAAPAPAAASRRAPLRLAA